MTSNVYILTITLLIPLTAILGVPNLPPSHPPLSSYTKPRRINLPIHLQIPHGGSSPSSPPSSDFNSTLQSLLSSPLYKFRPLTSVPLPCNIVKFTKTFLLDTASFPFSEFHALEGDTELSTTPWEDDVLTSSVEGKTKSEAKSNEGKTKGGGERARSRARTMEFRHPLSGPVGPSSTRISKSQVLLTYPCNSGVILKTTSTVHDVPGGGSFKVEDAIVVEKEGEEGVRVTVLVGVDFRKFSPLKSVITKSTYQDTNLWFRKWRDAAESYLTKPT